MTLLEIKKRLKAHLIDDLGGTLQQLLRVFEKNEELYNAVIALSAEHIGLIKREIQNLENQDDIDRKMNSLRKRVIDTIDQITEVEANIYNLLFSRFDKILVVCAESERKAAMQQLFEAQLWKEVEIVAGTELSPIPNLKSYRLLVFDNNGNSPDPNPPLLADLLAQTPKYILYYGSTHSDLVKNHPTRVYSANSIFSFHGRLQELLNFVRDFPEIES